MKNQPVIEACRNFRFRNTPETLRYFYHPDHIGSTSWVTDSAKNGIQYCEYLPFGEPFIDQRSTTWNSRYTFSGKERDGETGYSYFGARYYNSDISIWLSVDPMADKYPNLTPYAYCGNNPIVLVDPDGQTYSPIYDTDGNFLGTDDEGLQGEAIVMKRIDFKQGMSHEEALSKSTDLNTNNREEAEMKMNTHYSGLKNRPDYDGYLTKEEADAWWKSKSGQPLYVDQSKIDLPSITTESFDNKDGASIYKNFIWGLSNTGKVYGTLKLTLKDAKSGTVHIGGSNYMDEYDFRMDGRPLRDAATWVGRPGRASDGKSFLIYGYGKAKVPVVVPKK